MAIKFTTTKDAAKVNGVKVLVYGKAGTGKTWLCKTAPKPLIISAESGLLTLADVDIPVIKIESMKDLREAYDFVANSDKAKDFETICLDSLSEIAEIVLATAKKTVKDARQAYGELTDEMISLVKDFRDLEGKNVYFAAKETKYIDDVSQTVTYGPTMPGRQLGPGLPYYFDIVCNINIGKDEKGNEQHYLRTKGNFNYEAKNRGNYLAEIEKPDLTALFNKITKGIKAQQKENR